MKVAVNARGDAVVLFRHGAAAPRPSSALSSTFRPAGGAFGEAQPVAGVIHSEASIDRADVALTPDGHAIFVWDGPETADGPSLVRTAVREPDGSFGPVQTLSSPGRQARGARIGTDASGNAIAAWTEGGVVAVAHRPAGGAWSPAQQLGAHTGPPINAVGLGVSDAGDVFVAYVSANPLPGDTLNRHSRPVTVRGSSATGSFAAPRAFSDVAGIGVSLSMAPSGHALVSSLPFELRRFPMQVARRAPSGGFSAAEAVHCDPESFPQTQAVGSDGQAVLLFRVGEGPALISDSFGPPGAAGCPGSIVRDEFFSLIEEEPVTLGRLRARFAQRRPVLRRRSIEVVASCGARCRLRGTGSVKIAGRGRALRLMAPSSTAGRGRQSRLRLRLSRRDALIVTGALRRKRRTVARVRVRALGPGVQKRPVVLTARLRGSGRARSSGRRGGLVRHHRRLGHRTGSHR